VHAAYIPMFLYPFLNTISKTRPFEYLRLTSLGVIGALVKVRPGGAPCLEHPAVPAWVTPQRPWRASLGCACAAHLCRLDCQARSAAHQVHGAGRAGPAPPMLSPITSAGGEGCRASK